MCEIETQNAGRGSSIADIVRVDLERMIEQRLATIIEPPELLNAEDNASRFDMWSGPDRFSKVDG
jgi:hypothetical protein